MAFEIVKRGSKSFYQITFGTGDIKMMTSHEQEDNFLSMVILTQDVETSEDKWDATPSTMKTTDELDESRTAILKFNKVKSIDMLIESLQELRASMPEK